MLSRGDWVLDADGNEWRVHGSTKGARVLLERCAGDGMVKRSWKIAKWLTKLDPALYLILEMAYNIDIDATPIYDNSWNSTHVER